MNIYFDLLFKYLLSLALIYSLSYISTVLKNNLILKHILVFLISLVFSFVFLKESHQLSYIVALFFVGATVSGYLLLLNKIEDKWIIATIDFLAFSSILFISTIIVAQIDNLPIKHIIHEKVNEHSYSFSPGYLHDMITISLTFSFFIVCYKYLFSHIINKWRKYQLDKIENLQLDKKKIETQFEALQAKVNPHFLYNSLNSIAGLATVDGEKTKQMALALSRFFRYSMNREQEMLITIKDEVEILETYLEIEKIRFNNILTYHIDMPSEVAQYKVPRMLLQPIIENSIKHGLKGEIDSIFIQVSFSISYDTLTISIKDNGSAFPNKFIPGYGIKSVYDKLDLLFANDYELELKTHPEKDFRIYLTKLIK